MDHDFDDYSGDDGDHDSARRDAKGSGKGKSGDGDGKGEKKGVINRVNRACNNCRRMKMRCVGADDPPCKRCKNGGLECVMEKPGRPGGESAPGDDRIRSLENQVSAIQSTLTDLVTTLRAGMSSSVSNGSGQTPVGVTTTTPDYASSVASGAPVSAGMANVMMGPPSGSPSVLMSSIANSQSGFYANAQQVPLNPTALRSSNSSVHNDTFRNLMSSNSPFNIPGPVHDVSFPQFPQTSMQDTSNRATSLTLGTTRQRPSERPRHMSLPPSRAGSVGPEDILSPAAITNPLGGMANMAGLVEAAVERAREEQAKATGQVDGVPLKRSASEMERVPSGDDIPKKAKRLRFSPQRPTGPTIMDSQNLPPRAITPTYKPNPPKPYTHFLPDAVTEGFVSEEDGKELMRIFYAGSSNFLPVFDPNFDTWDSLRHRSPFSITSILYVGARVRDGGDTGELQRICKAHAEKTAVQTLFRPVQRIEAVQGMVLLSAFQDVGWLPGGHAVRMALDMGINRSFVHLLRTGMGKGKSKEVLEEERQLVVHSRVWFCLYLMEHQMAYGMGRPAIIREDETIHQCRRLLEHPLSITSDARLVSTVELIALRSPLHIELTAAPDLPIAESTMKRLKQANADFDAWERYWDRVLSDRFGKGRGDFFRESVIIQRQYAELFVNSQLLRGIREPTDVINMPEEKRALAIRAMRNAQRCLDICLHGENYRTGLRYAVHYTHVCAAFAASFLIRIARLFPHELNVKKTAKDVEELACVLSEIPAGRYARSLRLILRKARKEKIIPAPSAISSPAKHPMALPALTSNPKNDVIPFSPSQLINSNYYPTPSPAAGLGTILSPATAMDNAGAGSGMLFNLPTNAGSANSIINDSPASADLFEFDSLFAHETLERAGIQLGEDNHLPLFLDGTSLGASAAPTEMTPYMGLESFFIPQDVDNRLVDPNFGNPDYNVNNVGNGSQLQGGDGISDGIWW